MIKITIIMIPIIINVVVPQIFIIYTIGSITWMLSKWVFYRTEHRANGGHLKLNFEGPGIQRWNKPTDRDQKVDEKNVFICLVIMFTSRVIVIKMSNNGSFLYFLLMTAKN